MGEVKKKSNRFPAQLVACQGLVERLQEKVGGQEGPGLCTGQSPGSTSSQGCPLNLWHELPRGDAEDKPRGNSKREWAF